MDLSPLQLNDLTPYYNRSELILETARQIDKDFQMHGEEVPFSGNETTAYLELKAQIADIIARLLRINAQNLVNILYRIDLREKDIQMAFTTDAEEGTEGVLAHLIIERELKKVLIRHYFSQQSGE